MESFVIEGGRPLSGRVRAAGNKNGALPVIAASILTEEPVVLRNIPRIRDVDTMLALVADLGAEVEWQGDNELRIHAAGVSKTEVDEELSDRIRGSFLFAGPLLTRFGHALLSPPGGESSACPNRVSSGPANRKEPRMRSESSSSTSVFVMPAA